MTQMTSADREELVAWLKTRPQCIRDLAAKFPPGCKIRAEGYSIPSVFADCMGYVVSYTEGGELGIVDDLALNFGMRGLIKAEDAVLIECGLVSRGTVKEILEEING